MLHSGVGRVREAMCLVASFSGLAPSSVARGQCAAPAYRAAPTVAAWP